MAARGVIRKHIRFFFFWYCAGQRFTQSTRLIDSNRDNGRIVWHGTGWVPCFLRNEVVCTDTRTLRLGVGNCSVSVTESETLTLKALPHVTISSTISLRVAGPWVSDWTTDTRRQAYIGLQHWECDCQCHWHFDLWYQGGIGYPTTHDYDHSADLRTKLLFRRQII